MYSFKTKEATKKVEQRDRKQETNSSGGGSLGRGWKVNPGFQPCTRLEGNWPHCSNVAPETDRHNPHVHRVSFSAWGQMPRRTWPRFSAVLGLWPRADESLSPCAVLRTHMSLTKVLNSPWELEMGQGRCRSREYRAAHSLWQPSCCMSSAWSTWLCARWCRNVFPKTHSWPCSRFPQKWLVTSQRSGSGPQLRSPPPVASVQWGQRCPLLALLVCACPLF